ncbi:MAG: hypothetical protein A3H70_03730 [Candidatus Komeilibacteria bacterium RIFCSPLOWO2_02_FULL_48_11]|uniref:DegT/DnrJ/EryC1/StrS aminotransferase n=1 Tax=Candidatus Komeilibacteria bacterium RIFCSPLOWO2_02_FULL_48_11 TaxID=1798553 RepID=A0A1G2BNV2_9BACT|nr:MAG: hypothetical protein A3H70_03730 [Candidatus Komeilibacteria bacterium RIFCSPLOWO2_02_FULL_48_11]
MPNKEFVVAEVKEIIKGYFDEQDKLEAASSKYKVPLTSRLYNEDEVAEVVETLLSPERLTLNSASSDLKIEKFEEQFSGFIGVKNGIMMNSGSSADLAAFFVLTNPTIKNRLLPGDEVIVPAVNWNTSIAPLYALGLRPVFVDVDLKNYGMNIDQVRLAISPKTKAIMVIHLVGFPVDMDSIMAIAREHNLFVIEDTCESPGAEWNGKKVGSFGDMSTHSFYLSHHITTIEGGMLMTNNDEFAELARIIRSQGIMRNVKSQAYKDNFNSKYPDIDPLFLFTNVGYNFRPTEMEGAFGIMQFRKFGDYLNTRINNAMDLNSRLAKFSEYLILPVNDDNRVKCSWFFYPLMLKENVKFTVKDVTSFLEKNGIETRPVMSGDFTRHPVFSLFEHRIVGDLKNTKLIHKNGFFIGIHAGIGDKERDCVVSCFEEFFKNK